MAGDLDDRQYITATILGGLGFDNHAGALS